VEEEMKEYSRLELMQQVNSGLFQSKTEVEAAFLHDWAKLSVPEVEKELKDKDKLQDVLFNAFASINAAYMHYAVGSSETTYGCVCLHGCVSTVSFWQINLFINNRMTLEELAHFIYECGLFHYQKDRSYVKKIFTTALKTPDKFASLYSDATLSRVGFLHCVLRALILHHQLYGHDKDKLWKAFDKCSENANSLQLPWGKPKLAALSSGKKYKLWNHALLPTDRFFKTLMYFALANVSSTEIVFTNDAVTDTETPHSEGKKRMRSKKTRPWWKVKWVRAMLCKNGVCRQDLIGMWLLFCREKQLAAVKVKKEDVELIA